MRVGERDRVVVPVGRTGTDAGVGSTVLVAVRPERVELAAGDAAPSDASRLSGTVAQVVYLGTLTQFHVDTLAREAADRAPAVATTRPRGSPRATRSC